MKLFQYWDTGHPPDEVAAWIDGFRTMNPQMRHEFFDRDRASWFIGKHVGERERRAFDSCAVPSMQSDFFRLCALKRSGGLYVDADFRCLQPLAGLLNRAPHGMVASWSGEIVHNFFLIRPAQDPFVDACLRLCVLNIEAQDLPNAYTATGPGVLNAIQALLDPVAAAVLLKKFDNMLQADWLFPRVLDRARREIAVTDTLAQSFAAITLVRKPELLAWVGKTDPAYKQTERHWLNWRGSLYGAAAPGLAASSGI